MAASITDEGSIEPAAPVILFQTQIYLGGAEQALRSQYAVAPDGRFLINTVVGNNPWPPIVVIHNWQEK